MRNPIIYLAAVLLLALAGCSSENSTEPFEEPEMTGYVMDMEEGRILVVSPDAQDFSETGGMEEYYKAVWAGYATGNVEVGEQVKVWFDGGMEASYPGQADVKELEVIPGSTPEGATLSDTEALNRALTGEAFGNEILTVKAIEFEAERDEWSIVLKNTDNYEELIMTVDDK